MRSSRTEVFGWLLMAVLSAGRAAFAAETRDPWLWPFAADSIWNTPIGSDAVYVPANIAPAGYIGDDKELLFRVSSNAPVRAVYGPFSWQRRAWREGDPGAKQQVGEVSIPDDLLVADANPPHTPNNCSAFLMPDGRTVVQIAPLARIEQGGPVFGWKWADEDLLGAGAGGSHGGSYLSALGGSIRRGELTGPDPIRHVIKMDLWGQKYLYRATNEPDGRAGYRWPATTADSAAEQLYHGTNSALQMGSLLAIPPSVLESTLTLRTAAGRKLFHALQDYGAYIVDDSAWDCHYLCAEQGVSEELQAVQGSSFGTGGAFVDDVNELVRHLYVVDNNGPENVGGGGTRRAPPPPPFLP